MEILDRSFEPNEKKNLKDESLENKYHRFQHQAGGHTRLVKIGSGLIGKPMNLREVQFYQTKHKSIIPFLPKFKGIIGLHEYKKLPNSDVLPSPQYVVLEDLSSQYFQPCILDIKMGTRVHGDFANMEKIIQQSKKCEETTSKELGARLCGTIWHNPYESTTCKTDKYVGRKLDASGFETHLLHFFSDGKYIRIDVINQTIKKLKTLKRTVEMLESFRFFSCSLLFLYDGCEPLSLSSRTPKGPFEDDILDSSREKENDTELVKIKLIDFAHATYDGFMKDPVVHEGPDVGFIKGIDTILNILISAREHYCDAKQSQKSPKVLKI